MRYVKLEKCWICSSSRAREIDPQYLLMLSAADGEHLQTGTERRLRMQFLDLRLLGTVQPEDEVASILNSLKLGMQRGRT